METSLRVRFIRYRNEDLRIERRAKDDWQVTLVGRPWKASWAGTLRTAVLALVGDEKDRFVISTYGQDKDDDATD